MSDPSVNARYQRRFDGRHLSNTAARFDQPTRDRITDMLVTLDGWKFVEEAERWTQAEADRLQRLRDWETSGQIRRGDPGE